MHDVTRLDGDLVEVAIDCRETEVMRQAHRSAETTVVAREHHDSVELVMLDMVLPGMSGTEIFAALKALDPSVQVLIVSGYSMDGDAQRLLDGGVRGYLQKPYTLTSLAQEVTSILHNTPILTIH